MVHGTKWPWLIGCFCACYFATGAIWWRGSYQEALNTGFHWGTIPLLAGFALFLSWITGAGEFTSTIVVGSSFPAVIFARVVLDCIGDPTNHNLWPFEIAVAVVIGMFVTLPASVIGEALRGLTHRTPLTPPDVDHQPSGRRSDKD